MTDGRRVLRRGPRQASGLGLNALAGGAALVLLLAALSGCGGGAAPALRFGAPLALSSNAATDSGDDSAPIVVTDGASTWVVVWTSQDDLKGTIGNDGDILVSRSTDDGATWSDPRPLNSGAATDEGSDGPVDMTTDGAGNWLAVWASRDSLGGTIGGEGDILAARSSDNGATWTSAVALSASAPIDKGSDTAPHVSADEDGNWLVVWATRDSLGGAIGDDGDILVSRSTDAGVTWTPPAPLNTNARHDRGLDLDPVVTGDGSGNWVAAWSSYSDLGGPIGTDRDVLVSRSTDVGATWSDPAPLNANASTDTGDDLTPYLAVDEAGNWIAAWSSSDTLDNSTGSDNDILFSRSRDGGSTWSDPAALNTTARSDERSDESPQVMTDGKGWLAVWFSIKTPGANVIGLDIDSLFSRSSDGGATWTVPAVLNGGAGGDAGFDLYPHVAGSGGRWLAVWESRAGPDGSASPDSDILYSLAR